MKLYQKKNASLEDETVLVQLERRHTLKEDTNEAELDNPRKTIRANSLGNFGEGPSSTDIEVVNAEKQNFTRKPTVITESELSSSLLYKNRKAKINSDDESVEDPRSTMSHEDHEDLEPRTLNDPKLKPTPISNQRPRKMSSCCWYFTIVLVICIACLAVMAGVGGIVYMEYFAINKEKDTENTNASVKNDPSISKEIFQHPTRKQDNFHQNEPKIPENILKDIIKNSMILSENIDLSKKSTETSSQLNDDILRNADLMDSKNSKSKELSKAKSNLVSENQDIEMAEYPKAAEQSDVSRNIHGLFNRFNVPISAESVEIKLNAKNQDSFDKNLNHQSNDDMDRTSDRFLDKVNEQKDGDGSIGSEKSNNSTSEVLDSSEETLDSGRNFNFDEMTTLQGNGLKAEKLNADISFQNLHFLPVDKSHHHAKSSINDHGENSFDKTKETIDDDPKDNSLDQTEKAIGDLKDNPMDHTEHSIDHSPKNNSLDQTKQSINHNDKSLNDHNEDSSDFDSADNSTEEHSLVDQNQNSDDSTQLVFIRPIADSKAVPIPLAFLRRIGFDIKNPNSHQPLTAEDMDIKFSLAEALKYLRSLDTENKLPVSREKTNTRKTSNRKESKEAKSPIKSEREEYLNFLRQHIFEESS